MINKINTKMFTTVIVIIFVIMWVIPGISGEQKTTTMLQNDGNLSGYVTDTSSNPIEGVLVHVTFHGTFEEDYTDENGYYHVTNIPICYCYKNASASKQGYNTEWILLSITEDTKHNFTLTDEEPQLICGDANGDGVVNIGDAVYLINYIFIIGPSPYPITCVGDANSDGEVNVADIVYIVNYVFNGGSPPETSCCI